MLEAVPYSSANIFAIRDTWSFGGITNEIILVPFLKKRHVRIKVMHEVVVVELVLGRYFLVFRSPDNLDSNQI